ncbi:hypothetical protein G9A89_021917 [Geosiphon pyriformis]|nr:hypothetical protein G9A89_021917 [Geosiphon pyriformis]
MFNSSNPLHTSNNHTTPTTTTTTTNSPIRILRPIKAVRDIIDQRVLEIRNADDPVQCASHFAVWIETLIEIFDEQGFIFLQDPGVNSQYRVVDKIDRRQVIFRLDCTSDTDSEENNDNHNGGKHDRDKNGEKVSLTDKEVNDTFSNSSSSSSISSSNNKERKYPVARKKSVDGINQAVTTRNFEVKQVRDFNDVEKKSEMISNGKAGSRTKRSLVNRKKFDNEKNTSTIATSQSSLPSSVHKRLSVRKSFGENPF